MANEMQTASNGSEAVAQNLEHADHAQALNGDVHATTEAVGGPAEHGAEPALFGVMGGGALVSLAMLVFIIILLVKKVPAAIAGVLDKRIALIRTQLDDAARLRAEAEALKAEYEAKNAAAAKEAEDMRTAAQQEAADMIAAARLETEQLIVRRQKMAEDKIAAAERGAIAEVRARAAAAATAAAASLIRETYSAKADKALVDETIGKIAH